jgi:cathepsin L
MDAAIQYVADSDLGGLMSEESYQYLGQNAFCGQNATRRDEPPTARFKGFADIKKRDNEALMEAVYKHGPVAVSIDAAHESFRFYSEGVFTSKDCKIDPDDMDHAVLLVGYGTTEDGQDYWLIRNSWSTYWGESGYIRMARSSGNGEGTEDCGVTTDPVIAIVDPKYYEPAVPARVLFEPKAGADAASAAAVKAVVMQQ